MNNPRVEPNFTPTEQRILLLLGDGQHHLITELLGCLNDEMQDVKHIRCYVGNLRKKLKLQGKYITSEFRWRKSYLRLVRLMVPDDE